MNMLICNFLSCHSFEMKQRNEGPDGVEVQSVEQISVYEYFVTRKSIILEQSRALPCVNIGNSRHPVYIPLEVAPTALIIHAAEANSILIFFFCVCSFAHWWDCNAIPRHCLLSRDHYL